MKYSKKGWEKRQSDREGLKDFFLSCVETIKKEKMCCLECGQRLKGHVSEVAHILPKSSFRSIQLNKLNWIPLCGMYSVTQCHTNFDNNSSSDFQKMKINQKVKKRFKQLLPFITEKISYKIFDKYS